MDHPVVHPIVRMFNEEVRMIVDEFSEERIRTPPRDRRSLVVILRGLPGCGKSTFATFLKLYAESIGLEAQICSADTYFNTRQGYDFKTEWLGEAHARCQAYCFQALNRGVPVVIIDNTNVTYSEWNRYVLLAREGHHAFCRVCFVGNLGVQDLLARSWHQVPDRAMRKRLRLFYEDNDKYAAHYTVAIRQDVFAAQDDDPVLERLHPMELMFFELIRERVDAFAALREVAAGWDALQSLVFVLRGLPGCGKTTFALQTTVYAQARRLQTLVCSSDDLFRSRHGFHWVPANLADAREECLQMLRFALYRHVPVVVVDDAHITAAEWTPILAEVRLHQVVFVNFVCPSMEQAVSQISRTFTHRTQHDRDRLPLDFQHFQAAQLPEHVDVVPTFNSWDFITEDAHRDN